MRRLSLGRALLGLLVCALALGVLWAGETDRMRLADGAPMPPSTVLGVAAALAALGAPLLLYRSGVRFDPLRNRLETWWGMPAPVSRRERPLRPFDHVDVRKVVQHNGNDGSSTSYPVRLVGDEPLVIARMARPLPARRLAEHVARACNLPLHNAIAGEPVVRAPDELDLPLRERLRRADAVPAVADRPVHTRLEVDLRDGEVALKIPAPGLPRGGAALLVVLLPGVVFGFAVVSFGAGSPPGWFMALALAMVSLPVLLVGAISAHRGMRVTEVIVRPEALRVRSLRPWWTSEWARTGDRVEEIATTAPGPAHPLLGRLFPRAKLTVLTDESLCEIGLGLDDTDLAYLRRLIEAGLCGIPRRPPDGAREPAGDRASARPDGIPSQG